MCSFYLKEQYLSLLYKIALNKNLMQLGNMNGKSVCG